MTGDPVCIETLPLSPAPSTAWGGLRMLNGGKGYVAAPLGQLHYRDVGPRDARNIILLLHQSPMSMVEFGAVQNALAMLGVRSVAVDTPGYGMSDHPDILPTIGGFAENLVPALDALGIEKVFAAGHHTGACLATALARRSPDRVAGVILHGCPLYTPEESARFREHPEWDRSPKADGSHLSQLFRWPGDPPDDGEQLLRTWMSVTMYLQGADIGHWAVNRYDMAADLEALICPGLIITEAADLIHHMDIRARELRPDYELALLAEAGTAGVFTAAERWAALAAGFVGSVAG
jgi:pimeloyl-ACP methyl ester carboxylesterase